MQTVLPQQRQQAMIVITTLSREQSNMSDQLTKTQHHILSLLQLQQFYNGNDIGEQLGITRAAVWKAVKQLIDYGLPIESDNQQGYRLTEPMILLDKMKILPQLSSRCDIKLFSRISSTCDYLKQHAGLPSGTFCIAEQQIAGYGRHGRYWESPFGRNLYVSLAWDFHRDFSELSGLSLWIALGIVKALGRLNLRGFKIKWPNDIFFDGKKLGGVLVHSQVESNAKARLIISFGLNVNMHHYNTDTISQQFTCLETINAQPLDRNVLLISLLEQILTDLPQLSLHSNQRWCQEWTQYDALLNQHIEVNHFTETLSGIARGINAQGQLRLEQPDGNIQILSAGDTSISTHKI